MRNQLFIGVALAALAIPAAASAQETTTIIRGSVVDEAGNPVAGARVTVTHTPSGTVVATSTNADGAFTASGLRVGGPFTVAVNQDGKEVSSVTDIFTTLGQAYELPIQIGAAQDIVVTAARIQRAGGAQAGPQTVLTQNDISKVASVNRDVRDLARRDPFATLDLANSRAVSFAGVNPRFNGFTINGVSVRDRFGLNSDANPTGRGPVPFDAIEQFSVSIAPVDIRQAGFTGGAIDTVLRSGTNKLFVTGFYSQSTDGLQGDTIGAIKTPLPAYKSETYGVTVAGPILRDKLFGMISWERNTDPRPLAVPTIAVIPGISQALIDQVSTISRNVYGYNPGGFVSVTQNADEKIVGRIDWNIMEGQRLSLSYINAYDTATIAQGTSTSASSPGVGLASNYYTQGNLVRSGIIQLNSDWTDRLSTEARFTYQSNRRAQEPLLGRGFAQFIVCTAPTSVNVTGNSFTQCGQGVPTVTFGPDISRQTNTLYFDTYGGSLLTRLKAGNHEFKLLVEYNENRTRNAFLQRSSGAYYFDSIADFQNRQASQFDYATTVSGNPEDAVADFKYSVWTFGLQDDWRVTKDLTITAALRYDLYGQKNQPIFNNFFTLREGFPNTLNYSGLSLFQPRVSFIYTPTRNLKFRGTVGVFGGGNPDIYLSNAFSNTGVATNRIATVVRAATAGGTVAAPAGATTTCTAPYTGANAAVCTDALNNVQGNAIPASVNNFARTNVGSLSTALTNELDRDFKLPSVLKATLSADWTIFGIQLGADYLFTKTINQIAFTDTRADVIGRLPDGRPRYAAITTPTDSNYDILLYSSDLGRSHIGVVRAQKNFDFGLSLGGSYTIQDVKDFSPATSSVALSLYASQQAVDPNFPSYGTSNDQTTWAWKYNIGYEHAFFGDYRTVIQLFGETRSGRPYSFTMVAPPNRNVYTGTLGNTDKYLLYVPTGPNDPIVSYDSQATADSLNGLIESTALRNFRGQIAPKNIARSRAFTRIDLHLEQQIPTFVGKSRFTVFADIENLPNLINSDWGGLRQLGFPYTTGTVTFTCLQVPVATGTAPTTAQTTTALTGANSTCAQYRYGSFRAANTDAPNFNNSLYLIRLGVRFTW